MTLKRAQTQGFKDYAQQVLVNSKTLANELMQRQASLVTGGTDNHMMVVDTMESYGLDGRVAEETLDKVNITTNKQIIPDDPLPPLRPSGIRIGTPAATARGMGESDMKQLGEWIDRCLRSPEDEAVIGEIQGAVETFCEKFPVPGL